MAIHFNYIKGLNGNVTNLTTDSVYTYIKWSQGQPRNSQGNISLDCGYLPTIIVSTTNALDSESNGTTQCDLGHIITSSAINQTMENTFYFNKYAIFHNTTAGKNSIGFVNATNDMGCEYFSFITKVNNTPCLGCGVNYGGFGLDYHYANENNIDKNLFWIEAKAFKNNAFTVFDGKGNNDGGNNYGSYSDYNAWFTKSIKIDEHVDALYFNATSDQRAKSHIQLFKSNALDIVNKLPVYEFHYRNNDTPSIGVLAQDAITFDEQFTDFSLVNNPDATGEDGDFMTIKESKLVYILWKAVQEQQAQINYLQEQLNELKESL